MKADGAKVHKLCDIGGDAIGSLQALADAVGAKPADAKPQKHAEIVKPTGPLTHASIAAAIAAAIPENAIVVDEAVTTGRAFFAPTAGAKPHDWLQNMGGSIGYGTPVATGAAVACPDRRVIALEGDGSAMYTIQSLWTQAREQLDVTTVIFANRTYEILKGEFAHVQAGTPGKKAVDMLNLDRPAIDWLAHGEEHGRAGCRGVECRGLPQGTRQFGQDAGTTADRSADVRRNRSDRAGDLIRVGIQLKLRGKPRSRAGSVDAQIGKVSAKMLPYS